MAELKTKKTNASPVEFLNSVEDETKKADSFILLDLFKKVTKEEPKMWGTSIVGFGQYHYKSERSSQEGDWPLVAFSPRKQNLTLYIMPNLPEVSKLITQIGKCKTSVGCLYINKLQDVDIKILEKVIEESFKAQKKIHKVD